MGLWRGKKGSTVFYRIANSNSQQKQGMRERNYEPANPQTERQANQRLKMLPAQRVYGALKPVISRAWQGVKYGVMTRQAYLKAAMAMSSGYPYIDKDNSRSVPGRYQVSKGTLSAVTTAYSDIDLHETSLLCGLSPDAAITVGDLTQELLDLNDTLQNGDQITVIVCTSDAANLTEGSLLEANYNWYTKSFYLDENGTDTLGTLGLTDYLGSENAKLSVHYKDNTLVASAVIISRQGDGGTNLRSTATLFVPDQVIDAWSSVAQQLKTVRSYQRKNPEMQNYDWPVDDTDTPAGSIRATYTLTGLTGQNAVFNGMQCMVLVSEDSGDLTAVYVTTVGAQEGLLVGTDGQALSANVEMEDVYLNVTNVSYFVGLPTVQWQA